MPFLYELKYMGNSLFFVVKGTRKPHFKGFSFTSDGEKVSDDYIKQLLINLLSVDNLISFFLQNSWL